tara:strand:+ start:3206 stop:4867 length:1662 start_codon:yes stop_codon:yes gene_type:complete
MSYKFQVGKAALSGGVLQRLGSSGQDSRFVLQDDAGSTKIQMSASGEISGSALTIAHGGDVFLHVDEAAVDVSADSIYFYDSDGSMHRDSFADYATAIAGAGLAASGGALSVDIDELSALGGTGVAQGDHFLISDGGTEKKITASNLEDWMFGNVSGDATIAAGGALTIANDAVESGMLNDNVISGQTELAQGSLAAADELLISDGGTLKKFGVDSLAKDALALTTEAAIADGDYITFLDGGSTGETKKEALADLATLFAGDGLVAASSVLAVQVDDTGIEINSDTLRLKDNGVTLAKMAGITRGSIIIGDSSGDPSLLAKGTAAQFLQSDGTDPSYVSISGDATVAAGGALTIANDAVESGMLNDNVISGQSELAAEGLVAADEMMISDGGVLKKIGVDNLFADQAKVLSAGAIDVSADHLMFADGSVTGAVKMESFADLASAMAGAGLAASAGTLTVQGNTVTAITHGVVLTEGYNVATGSNGTAVYLPTNVTAGDVYTVKAQALGASNVITISPRDSDGHTIDGETSVTIMSQYGAVTMVYAATGSWLIV